MTAHWIKVEKDTAAKPEVMRLAAMLDIDEFTVVGHLIAFWSWVDSNLSPECPQTQGTKRGLDRIAGRTGFCDALISTRREFFCTFSFVSRFPPTRKTVSSGTLETSRDVSELLDAATYFRAGTPVRVNFFMARPVTESVASLGKFDTVNSEIGDELDAQ